MTSNIRRTNVPNKCSRAAATRRGCRPWRSCIRELRRSCSWAPAGSCGPPVWGSCKWQLRKGAALVRAHPPRIWLLKSNFYNKIKRSCERVFFKLYHNLTLKVKFSGRTPASSCNLKFEKALKFLYNIYRKWGKEIKSSNPLSAGIQKQIIWKVLKIPV